MTHGGMPDNCTMTPTICKSTEFEPVASPTVPGAVKCKWCKGGVFVIEQREDHCSKCGRPVIWSDFDRLKRKEL